MLPKVICPPETSPADGPFQGDTVAGEPGKRILPRISPMPVTGQVSLRLFLLSGAARGPSARATIPRTSTDSGSLFKKRSSVGLLRACVPPEGHWLFEPNVFCSVSLGSLQSVSSRMTTACSLRRMVNDGSRFAAVSVIGDARERHMRCTSSAWRHSPSGVSWEQEQVLFLGEK